MYAFSTGFDASFPNCKQLSLFPKKEFAILGVSNGKAFTKNFCLFSEYEQVLKNAAPHVSLYMNLNAPTGVTVPDGLNEFSSILETCISNDIDCHGFNYGYHAAKYAYTYASSQGIFSRMWWIDVELANSWFDDPLENRSVLEGAIAFFKGGLSPQGQILIPKQTAVGVYSTPSMWHTITDNWTTHLPAWIGTDEESSPECAQSFTNPSEKAFLMQFYDPLLDLDKNITCRHE